MMQVWFLHRKGLRSASVEVARVLRLDHPEEVDKVERRIPAYIADEKRIIKDFNEEIKGIEAGVNLLGKEGCHIGNETDEWGHNRRVTIGYKPTRYTLLFKKDFSAPVAVMDIKVALNKKGSLDVGKMKNVMGERLKHLKDSLRQAKDVLDDYKEVLSHLKDIKNGKDKKGLQMESFFKKI